MNDSIGSIITEPKMLKRPPHSRYEGCYAKSIHNHEVAHGLYTSRDFKGMNEMCVKNDVVFHLVNIFEDARIESLFRGRRPYKTKKVKELNDLGVACVEAESYGVRKFEWHKWDELSVQDPASTLLSFIKCEGTKSHTDRLKQLMLDTHGTLDPWASEHDKHKGVPVGYALILAFWRKVAGRGASKRYAKTEDLMPLIVEWNKHFPYPKGEEGLQGFGPGNDVTESAREAGVTTPHGTGKSGTKSEAKSDKTKMEESVATDKQKTWEGKHDLKYGEGQDEGEIPLTKAELKKRGLSEHYFTVEFLN